MFGGALSSTWAASARRLRHRRRGIKSSKSSHLGLGLFVIFFIFVNFLLGFVQLATHHLSIFYSYIVSLDRVYRIMDLPETKTKRLKITTTEESIYIRISWDSPWISRYQY